MAQLNEIYKCQTCGNIVEVVHSGNGVLICCGQPMQLLKANTVDAAKEKHVPVIEKTAAGFRVKIGVSPHPMTEAHYIEWIEVIANGKVGRKYLKPGDQPEAEFNLLAQQPVARAYCNLHGLWQSEL